MATDAMGDLKQRYIYAVIKGLPRGARADIERELETLIEDMLEERCGERPATKDDLRVVLSELGTPAQMQKKYSPDGSRALIGPDYYPAYKLTITIVLAAFAIGITVAKLVSFAMDGGIWYRAVLDWLGELLSGGAGAFAVVTLIFAGFERHKVRLDLPGDSIDDLPAVPKREELVSRTDCIIGMVLCVLFTLAALVFPQAFCFIQNVNGAHIVTPIFDAEVLRAGWPWILLFGAAGLARDIFCLVHGRYSMRLLAAVAALDIASIPLACLMLLRDGLISPALTQSLQALLGEMDPGIFRMLENFHIFLLGVILFALVLDIATTLVRTLRLRKVQ